MTLAWKTTGLAPAVHSSECGRFTIEAGHDGHTAYRFDDLADIFPVEKSEPMMLDAAKQWCEQRAAQTADTDEIPLEIRLNPPAKFGN